MNWSSEENIKIVYRLLNVKGFGPVQTNRLLLSLKPSVSSASQLELSIFSYLAPDKHESFSHSFELYQKEGRVRYMSFLDETLYPRDLVFMLSHNSPTILSYMGNIDLLNKKKVGFSGSRKVSEKGIWITEDCVRQLTDEDVCIVSGYANGVDAVAHATALDNGGCTIIVLPEGISHFYIKKFINSVWDWNRVLVVSEFSPYDRWMAQRAMKRNSTIIGLSDAMVVVEAGDSGGSLDAGLKTMEAGKPLFVPRYNILPDSAKGNEILLSKGANPLGRKEIGGPTNLSKLISSLHSNTSIQSLQNLNT